jgi:hypothetical protein
MDDMTKAMFGCHAVHTGINMIMQAAGDGRIIIVAQSSGNGGPHPLMFGSKKTHVLCMGDMVIRPHLVFGSNEFRGAGLTNLMKDGFISPEKWVGDVILENLPSRYSEMKGI